MMDMMVVGTLLVVAALMATGKMVVLMYIRRTRDAGPVDKGWNDWNSILTGRFSYTSGEAKQVPSELWRGLVGYWVPEQSPTGLTLRRMDVAEVEAALSRMNKEQDMNEKAGTACETRRMINQTFANDEGARGAWFEAHEETDGCETCTRDRRAEALLAAVPGLDESLKEL